MAVQPVFQGSDLAMAAAAQAASATGGVTVDWTATQKTRRWAVKGATPILIRAGTPKMTRMT